MSTDSIHTNTGWSGLLSNGHLARISILCLGVWLHAANSMLVATTLPSAVKTFGGAHLVSWAFTLYLLGSILAGAAAGLMIARGGLKNALLTAATLYAIGSAVCATSPDMQRLLVGRFLQGLGGGGLVALSFIAVNRLFPPQLMPRLIALISAVWSISAFCGPLIGGSFATWGYWRLAFWAFAIQAVLFIFATWFVISTDKPNVRNKKFSLPVVRLIVVSAAILSVAFAGSISNAVLSLLCCFGSLLLFFLFLKLDHNADSCRMLPSHPFSINTTVGAGIILITTAATATMSFLVYGPFFLETLFQVTPLVAGYIVALESVSWGVLAILVSGVKQDSEPWLIKTGTLLISASVFGFALTMSGESLLSILLCAVFQGAGFGIMWSAIVRRLIKSAPPTEQDIASSAIPTTQQAGFALGAALAGIIANLLGFNEHMPFVALTNVAFWVFAAFIPLMVCANIAAWKFTR